MREETAEGDIFVSDVEEITRKCSLRNTSQTTQQQRSSRTRRWRQFFHSGAQVVQLTWQEKVTSDKFLQDPETGEEYCSDLHGETDGSAKQQKGLVALEARRDLWSMSGDFLIIVITFKREY